MRYKLDSNGRELVTFTAADGLGAELTGPIEEGVYTRDVVPSCSVPTTPFSLHIVDLGKRSQEGPKGNGNSWRFLRDRERGLVRAGSIRAVPVGCGVRDSNRQSARH